MTTAEEQLSGGWSVCDDDELPDPVPGGRVADLPAHRHERVPSVEQAGVGRAPPLNGSRQHHYR